MRVLFFLLFLFFQTVLFSQTCPIVTLANDLEVSNDLDGFLAANRAQGEGVKIWLLLIDNPIVRKHLSSLENLKYILENSNLLAAGFNYDNLKAIIDFINLNPDLFNVIATQLNPNNGLQKLIEGIKNLDGNGGSLSRVNSGLSSETITILYGELFRLSQLNAHIDDVSDIEKYIVSPGPPYSTQQGRYADLVIDGVNTETKYLANILTSQSDLVVQMHKDLLTIRNLIISGTPPNEAFSTFAFRFKKSSGVTSLNEVRSQIIELFNQSCSSCYVDIANGGTLTYAEVLADINARVFPNNGYSNFTEYINSSPKIEFIP